MSFLIAVAKKEQYDALEKRSGDREIAGIAAETGLALDLLENKWKSMDTLGKRWAMLPYILREENKNPGLKDMETLAKACMEGHLSGLILRNLEELGYLSEIHFSGRVLFDYGLYNWNSESIQYWAIFLKNHSNLSVQGISLPLELTKGELSDLEDSLKRNAAERDCYQGDLLMQVYGRAPMMVTAGCIRNTLEKCSGMRFQKHVESGKIKDRKGYELPVHMECRYCYNIIWNSVPTSLHGYFRELNKYSLADIYRLDFTTENAETSLKVTDYYMGECRNPALQPENGTYTTGHYKKETL